MPQNVIDMVDINMSFNGVPVLKHVNFSLQKGEIMGLIGKNGAGKSTLLKIIQGIYTPDSGDIYIDGKKLSPKVKTAERNSLVSMIYQDFSLIPEMTVVQNIFLNAENTRWGLIEDRKQEDVVKRFFARYGIRIDPRADQKPQHVGYANGGDHQISDPRKKDHPHGRTDGGAGDGAGGKII